MNHSCSKFFTVFIACVIVTVKMLGRMTGRRGCGILLPVVLVAASQMKTQTLLLWLAFHGRLVTESLTTVQPANVGTELETFLETMLNSLNLLLPIIISNKHTKTAYHFQPSHFDEQSSPWKSTMQLKEGNSQLASGQECNSQHCLGSRIHFSAQV